MGVGVAVDAVEVGFGVLELRCVAVEVGLAGPEDPHPANNRTAAIAAAATPVMLFEPIVTPVGRARRRPGCLRQ
ncbi:hypothetical protein WDJ51_12430 [Rathayibacter sp. YIM 133350]|uniref:hypothetical protein n=1 Tax=Rathayibacter sp. YIM 133350 TaxID=3131992 RepID=UPI00307CD24F